MKKHTKTTSRVAKALALIGVTNYRQIAQNIIAKYDQKGMVTDAMVWSQVIDHYESERIRIADLLESVMASDPDMSSHEATMAEAENALAFLRGPKS